MYVCIVLTCIHRGWLHQNVPNSAYKVYKCKFAFIRKRKHLYMYVTYICCSRLCISKTASGAYVRRVRRTRTGNSAVSFVTSYVYMVYIAHIFHVRALNVASFCRKVYVQILFCAPRIGSESTVHRIENNVQNFDWFASKRIANCF